MAVAKSVSIPEDWMEPDKLILLTGLARDGFNLSEIGNQIGVSYGTLKKWCKEHKPIRDAINQGKQITDYKVEDALLKSALGFRKREVTIKTKMIRGKVVEVIKEETTKEESPNVTAAQVYLYNKCPDKWKRNRDQILPIEEDSNITITIDRKSNKEKESSTPYSIANGNAEAIDRDVWEDVNESITISANNPKEEKKKRKTRNVHPSVSPIYTKGSRPGYKQEEEQTRILAKQKQQQKAEEEWQKSRDDWDD